MEYAHFLHIASKASLKIRHTLMDNLQDAPLIINILHSYFYAELSSLCSSDTLTKARLKHELLQALMNSGNGKCLNYSGTRRGAHMDCIKSFPNISPS